MKRFLLISLSFITFHFSLITSAQVDGGSLNEVTVMGSRSVLKNDALWIFPTETELKHSTNAYSLLGKLSLEGIRIDPSAHSLTAIDNRGGVSVRINDIPATVQDMLSLDMTSVVRIEYTDRPGLRYGEDVAYAINIVVKRPTSGYALGTDLTHDLTRRGLSDNVFGRFNKGKSMFGLDYSIDYADHRGSLTDETADYTLTDGTIRTITRSDISSRSRNASQKARLSYSLADSNYVFQARLSNNGDINPNRYRQERQLSDNFSLLTHHSSLRQDESRTHSPAFDLYYHRDFARHQQLTASATVTHIHTSSDNSYDEGSPYSYHVNGCVWSFKSEALYENQLNPFTWTVGMQYNQRYTNNEYQTFPQPLPIREGSEYIQGQSLSTPLPIGRGGGRVSSCYVFSQLSGKLFSKLQYKAGVGLSRRYYRQGEHHHDFLTLRPRLNVSYPLAKGLRLNYDYQRSQHTSQIAQTNDVTLQVNSMELLVGNPDLKPNVVTEHTLRLNYQQPRLTSSLLGYAKLNAKPNMHRYIRTADNVFIDTQENQPHINLLMTQGNVRYDLIPDKLNASLTGQYVHCDNKGWDYRHRYNALVGTFMLNAYLGRWTLMAYADTGWRWLEGEMRGRNGVEVQFVASYQTGPLSLSLYCRNPFCAHPLVHEAELLNANLHKLTTLHDSDQGNYFGLNFTYRLSHGRKYQDIRRTITLEDHDSGILK